MPPLNDDKHAVAAHFASRPTLRQVAGQQLMQVLIAQYPAIAHYRPELTSAQALYLMIPQVDGTWSHQPFVDYVLQALLTRRVLDFPWVAGLDYRLSLQVPYRFYANPDPFQSSDDDVVRPQALTAALNDLLLLLPEQFCQAQADYWQALGVSGVSRDLWLQQTIKAAWLANLPMQNLDAEQQSYIHGALQGGQRSPSVSVVQVRLSQGSQSYRCLLPHLLIMGESDARKVLLWCAPCSVIRAFDSLDEFALALQDTFAQRHAFEGFVWDRFELEGDAFAQLSALMLEALLEPVTRVRYWQLADVDALEQCFAGLCDPSRYFVDGYRLIEPRASTLLPPRFLHAAAADSFACQCALFDLALAQAQSDGIGALEGVLDLHAYTRQQLRAQLLADHPDDANYFPDDLELTLTIARGTPGGAGAGVGGGSVEHRRLSLTEFAIGNLSALQGAVLSAVHHRQGQLIMDWMNPAYVQALVQKVDIGGHYPAYVAQCLDDPEQRPQRVARFGREWRCSLLFSALSARLANDLSEAGLQCVVDYCRGVVDPQLPAQMLMPLAFKREATAPASDQATGMYVLFSTQPACVLLYRPLYGDVAITEYPSIEAMMAAIGQAGALQTSVLDWLSPQARRVYDWGGFLEPHLLKPIFDTSVLPARVKPASFEAQFWQRDVDAQLYQANRDLLVELADRQTVSNQESRWAILTQGAWLLFDLVSLWLRGPVASVAWLVQALGALQNDVAALRGSDAFQRSAAVVDLLLNASMALMHLRLPGAPQATASVLPAAATEQWPRVHPASRAQASMPAQGKVGLPGALAEQATRLDFSWRGAQGLNVLSAERRKALQSMRVRQSLSGLEMIESGDHHGLYAFDGQHYLQLAGDVYGARVTDQGVRIVDQAGRAGPWVALVDGQWRIDHALRLRAGMPRSRLKAMREENQKLLESLRHTEADLARNNNRLGMQLEGHREMLIQKDQQIEALLARPELDELSQNLLDLTRRLRKKLNEKVIYELKAVVENGIEHDQVLARLNAMRIDEKTLLDSLSEQRSSVRQALIQNLSVYYNEMAKMINDEGLDDISKDIAVRPEGEREIQHYKDFLGMLENVIKWETDLVDISRVLDKLLVDTLNDSSILYRDEASGARINKDLELKETIERRRLSAIDLDFRLLLDLAEASLDRLVDVDERTLEQYLDYLGSETLISAGNAHGDLAASELSAAERIEVLAGILEVYEEARGMADYLTSLGGPAIRQDRLQQYKLRLEGLQSLAEKDMAEAVREKELEQPPARQPPTYAPRGGRRKVVRTNRGRSVLGEEVEIDGVAVVQQRDFRTQNVIKTFHKQGEEWVEQAAGLGGSELPPFSPKDPRIARQRAQALVDQVDSVISLARLYVKSDEALGLSTVVEEHIDKIKEAQAKLPRLTPEDELFDSLSQAVTRLQATQRALLTGMYLVTFHPTAKSLRFLVEHQEVTVHRAGPRRMLSAKDYLDVYEIRRRVRAGEQEGEGLWEAHFHYPTATTGARQFSKGHLKLWSQRKLGRKAQLQAAATGKDLLAIYRGEVRLNDVEGIIPFD